MSRKRGLASVIAVVAMTGAMTIAATPSGAESPHGVPPEQFAKPPPLASCDPIDTTQCLMPFPDDYFTTPDKSTPTGHHLDYPRDMMPANGSGVHIDPADINRSDGFSPGSTIIVPVPGIDLAQTGAAPITDIARSLDPDAPIVLLDTDTGQRVPYWAELDTWNPDPTTRALVVRPARDFGEGDHIIVALRNMKDANGTVIPAPPSFARLRDYRPSFDLASIQRLFELFPVFARLEKDGVRRQSLYLAWDFTVASEQDLAGGMLHMRDDTYAQLGSGVPAVTVTQVDQNPNPDVSAARAGNVRCAVVHDQRRRSRWPARARIERAPDERRHVPRGVPLSDPRVGRRCGRLGAPGTRRSCTATACSGARARSKASRRSSTQYDIVICATPEIGMASDDVPNVVASLSDMSTFGSIPDRLQQGLLNTQFLARLLKDPRGFGANPAFQVGATPVSPLVPNQVFYNGNSQGGIFGGAATAISKEWTRAVLGVPAMNYSVLLPRSVDFDPFLSLLKHSYPDQSLYTLMIAMDQILWDRGEPDGYAQHMISNPYPGTPTHQVLMIEAFGDHQVANIGTETEARTIGAFVRQPAIAPGRSNDVTPMWDIPAVPSSPFSGSVLELWDFGTPAPPVQSLPPESPQFGSDPHGAARNVPAVQQQVSRYLRPFGVFVDKCGPDPCHP